jgi:hypothetical protein
LNERHLAVGERFSAPGILRADQGQGARVVVIGPKGFRREASHV